MTDRTSARIFGDFFKRLSTMPGTPDRQAIGKYMLEQAGEFDFTLDDMNADEALALLDLVPKSHPLSPLTDADYVVEGISRRTCGKSLRSGRAHCELNINHDGECL